MADEDVNRLVFGPDFEYAEFLSNTEVAVLLDATVEQRTRSVPGYRPPEILAKAREYATAHMGAVQILDPADIDAVFTKLKSFAFERADDGGAGGDGDDDGGGGRVDRAAPVVRELRLRQYQVVALANLNPSTVAAARSLIPSLAPFTDEELGEMLAVLRGASAKYGGVEG